VNVPGEPCDPSHKLRSSDELRRSDEHWMDLALSLAEKGLGFVEPNPAVGCVLVRDGVLIGQGYHRRFGGLHAEVEALNSCDEPRGATAYVTLEPCCHHGKTPPCSTALIEAGVARVVAAMEDPFAEVNGGGLAQLRAAGIVTEIGVSGARARALNAPYLKRLRTGCPWVIAKWAMTADGRIATVTGESQWITGEAARRDVHRHRGRVDGIAVGMGTVISDDPLLTARTRGPAGEAERPPRVATRMVFCRHRVPSRESNLVRSAGDIPLAIVAGPTVPQPATESLNRLGVQILRCHAEEPAAMVIEALQQLSRGIAASTPRPQGGDLSGAPATTLLVEGGGELLGSFFAAGQVDECHVYIGPLVVGGQDALGPVGGAGVARLADAHRMWLQSVETLGEDVKLVYRRVGGD
jgi:diaminohydroxyphosphoribosylaminopyrimidine deaminase/5-amino-6-(5-phosphoribosylamino)uracil reductase